MAEHGRPRVTVAIPLHRSAPFIDIVSANIERIPRDAEIIVSDQTLVDGALEELRRRHDGDLRLTFLPAEGSVGWVDHYNTLLRRARGELFMWMPHDDDFPPDYVPLLTAALDRNPHAILACGSIRAVSLDSTPIPEMDCLDPPPEPRGGLPRVVEALRVRRAWNLAILFRGLMRRDEILRRRLWIRHKLGDEGADITWAFAVVSSAPIAFEPRCTCVKRYHPDSTHAAWRRHHTWVRLAAIPVVLRYFVAARLPRRW